MPTVKLIFFTLATFTVNLHACSSAPNTIKDHATITVLFSTLFNPTGHCNMNLIISHSVIQQVTIKILKQKGQLHD